MIAQGIAMILSRGACGRGRRQRVLGTSAVMQQLRTTDETQNRFLSPPGGDGVCGAAADSASVFTDSHYWYGNHGRESQGLRNTRSSDSGDVEEGGEMRKYLMMAFAAVIFGFAWAIILQ